MTRGFSFADLCPVTIEKKEACQSSTACPNLTEAINAGIERFSGEQARSEMIGIRFGGRRGGAFRIGARSGGLGLWDHTPFQALCGSGKKSFPRTLELSHVENLHDLPSGDNACHPAHPLHIGPLHY